MANTTAGTAAIYVRISRDQTGQGIGVRRQRKECGELAARLGLTVVDQYEDNDVSAYSRKPRPEFERLIADARAGRFDTLVVWATDRLYRQPRDLERIVDQIGGLRVVTVVGGDVDLSSADGKANARMLGVMAAHESDRKAERLKARHRQRIEGGRMTLSVRAFGWAWVDPCPGGDECLHLDAEGRPRCEPGQVYRPRMGTRRGLVPHPVEGPAVAQVFAMVDNGDSIRSAARWLNAHGFVGVKGAKLGAEQTRAIVVNPRNAGLVANRGRVVGESADGARLVDPDLFRRVQVRLSDPTRRTSPGRPSGTLLSGIARCGKCGGPMNASTNVSRGSDRARFPTYICQREKHLSRRRTLVDDVVVQTVAAVLDEQIDGLREYAAPVGEDDDGAAEVDRLTARLDELDALYAADGIDLADYAFAKRSTRAKLDEIRDHAARVAGRPALAALLADDEPAARWLAMVTDENVDPARAVVRELLDRVVVLTPAVARRPSLADVRLEGGWFPS
jgi:site-specific DNA recombinase